VDTVLASLIAALVAYGGHSPREKADTPIHAPDFDDLVASLRLLARLTPRWTANAVFRRKRRRVRFTARWRKPAATVFA